MPVRTFTPAYRESKRRRSGSRCSGSSRQLAGARVLPGCWDSNLLELRGGILWRTVYLMKLSGLEKKLRVGLQWALRQITSRSMDFLRPAGSPGGYAR